MRLRQISQNDSHRTASTLSSHFTHFPRLAKKSEISRQKRFPKKSNKKFKVLHQNKLHIIKSLIYFEDANHNPMPKMLKEVKWNEVKKFFETEVKRTFK